MSTFKPSTRRADGGTDVRQGRQSMARAEERQESDRPYRRQPTDRADGRTHLGDGRQQTDGGGKSVDVRADGRGHVTPRKVGKGIGRLKRESESRARNRTVQEAVRALKARIGRMQQPMEQNGRIGIGRRVARTLEEGREKRRKVDEGRGTKQNELSESESH
jgi:hypothetical protein